MNLEQIKTAAFRDEFQKIAAPLPTGIVSNIAKRFGGAAAKKAPSIGAGSTIKMKSLRGVPRTPRPPKPPSQRPGFRRPASPTPQPGANPFSVKPGASPFAP